MIKTVRGVVVVQPWFIPHNTDPNKNVLVVQIDNGKELINVAAKGHRICNVLACYVAPGRTMHFRYEEGLGMNWVSQFIFGEEPLGIPGTFMCDEDGLSTVSYQKRMEVLNQWRRSQSEAGWDGKSNEFGYAVVDKSKQFVIPE